MLFITSETPSLWPQVGTRGDDEGGTPLERREAALERIRLGLVAAGDGDLEALFHRTIGLVEVYTLLKASRSFFFFFFFFFGFGFGVFFVYNVIGTSKRTRLFLRPMMGGATASACCRLKIASGLTPDGSSPCHTDVRRRTSTSPPAS